MIARADLTQQILENSLKNRVTACRKRVRNHRGVNRGRRDEAMLPAQDSSPMAQFLADSRKVRQLVSLELSSVFDNEPAESVEQEVGIT